MNASRPVRGLAAVLSCAALAACLSTSPALPAVRWFDPLPSSAAVAAPPAGVGRIDNTGAAARGLGALHASSSARRS